MSYEGLDLPQFFLILPTRLPYMFLKAATMLQRLSFGQATDYDIGLGRPEWLLRLSQLQGKKSRSTD